MKIVKNLDDWTTDELLAEVLDRSAGDRPALDRIQAKTMRALLNDRDQKADAGSQPSHWARRSSVDRSR
jgi:hypothetical protein